MGPTIAIRRMGNLGNQMFQYMFGRSLQARVKNASLTGYGISDFNIHCSSDLQFIENRLILTGHAVDINRISYLLNEGIFSQCELAGFFLRYDYYRDPGVFGALFNAPANLCQGYGDDFLVINVRAGDIMRNLHADYTPLPLSYYRHIIETSRLKPVFMGQIDSSEYVAKLKANFPSATFVGSQGPLKDFEIIRRSRNIVLPISTFSWLASWFSCAKIIHFPIYGAYNPEQRPDVDLLPVNDERYKFYKFPIAKWTATQRELDSLFSEERVFVEVSSAQVSRLFVNP